MSKMNGRRGSSELKLTKPIRLIELFAGIGSQAKALRNIGANFEHHRVVEFDKYAMASYNAVHDTNFTVTDICDIGGKDLGITDLDSYDYMLTYSFPCTDISNAGLREGMAKGSGTRSGLLWEVERLLDEMSVGGGLPQTLLMENVPQVVGKKNTADFTQWINKLESLGYYNYYAILDAQDYDLAQHRERCFMVSTRYDSYYYFPMELGRTKCLQDYCDDVVDAKYYLTERQIELIHKSTYNFGRTRIKDGRGIARTLCARDWKDPMCLALPNCGARKLTPREYWRLMGFTDEDFDRARAVGMSDTQLYKQAGNSIAIPVLEQIFGCMLK